MPYDDYYPGDDGEYNQDESPEYVPISPPVESRRGKSHLEPPKPPEEIPRDELLDEYLAETEADKHLPEDFIDSERERDRIQRDWNHEALEVFKQVASDLSDDFYALHELRVNLESSRTDVSDHGL